MPVRLESLDAIGLTAKDWPLSEAVSLLEAAAPLGPRARGLLIAIAGRLAKGAAEHGDFDPAVKRELRRETLDELLDATVYLSCALQAAATQTPGCECDAQGYTPRGTPWLPVDGDWVRIVARWASSSAQVGAIVRVLGSTYCYSVETDQVWVSLQAIDWPERRLVRVVPTEEPKPKTITLGRPKKRVICPRDRMPKRGERVRVIEVAAGDRNPSHRVGDEGVLIGSGIADGAWAHDYSSLEGYLVLGTPQNGGIPGSVGAYCGTYCKVEILP